MQGVGPRFAKRDARQGSGPLECPSQTSIDEHLKPAPVKTEAPVMRFPAVDNPGD